MSESNTDYVSELNELFADCSSLTGYYAREVLIKKATDPGIIVTKNGISNVAQFSRSQIFKCKFLSNEIKQKLS